MTTWSQPARRAGIPNIRAVDGKDSRTARDIEADPLNGPGSPSSS